MKCEKCELENLDNAKFCSNCGTNLIDTKSDSANINANIKANVHIKNETTERILDGIGDKIESGKNGFKRLLKILVPIGIAVVIIVLIVNAYYIYESEQFNKQIDQKRQQEEQERQERIDLSKNTFSKNYYNNGVGRTFTSKNGQSVKLVMKDFKLSYFGKISVYKFTINGAEFYVENNTNYVDGNEKIIYKAVDSNVYYTINDIVSIAKLKGNSWSYYSYATDIIYVKK